MARRKSMKVRTKRKTKSRTIQGYLQVNRNGFGFVTPERNGDDIYISRHHMNGAIHGDKVEVSLVVSRLKRGTKGVIVSVLDRPLNIINTYKNIYGVRDTFSSKILTQASKIDDVLDVDLVNFYVDSGSRRDLRDKTVFTIDGYDAKDFDDAVSIEKREEDFILGVHIADVAHYVTEFTQIDKEARLRGTSVYLPNEVIPMLPHELSDGACSLKEGLDRFTLTCEMVVDNVGNVKSYEIYESVICSKKRLIYEDVSDYLENGNGELVKEEFTADKKTEQILDALTQMNQLYLVLNSARERRGSIEFELDEAKVIVEDGNVISVGREVRRSANKLIEEFMLLANETVAKHFFTKDMPCVYRVHEPPEPDKLEEFVFLAKDYVDKISIDVNHPSPLALNELLANIKNEPYSPILADSLLRCMQKAVYKSQNLGHFGLALSSYLHFTSPIRRYPDLQVHRILKEMLLSDKSVLLAKRKNYYRSVVGDVSLIASLREQKAVSLERDVKKYYMAKFMEKHIGESFSGVISGIVDTGIFVKIFHVIEGRIHISEYTQPSNKDILILPREHRIILNPITVEQRLDLSKTVSTKEKVLHLGDSINVVVESVDTSRGNVELVLVED